MHALALISFILVPDDAYLFIHPDEASAHFRASDPNSGAVSLSGGVGAYRFVGKRGAFVEIETLSHAECEEQCVCASWAPPGRLRLFVRADQIVSATTREVTFAARNGGSITLAAGVPVLRSWVLIGDFFRLRADVPPDAVGQTFERTRRLDPDVSTTTKTRGVMPLGLEAVEPLLAPREFPIRAQKQVGSQIEVTIAFRCAELRFTTLPNHVVAANDKSGSSGVLGILQKSPPERFVARQGARLFWPDGTPAGVVKGTFTFSESRTVGSRICVELPLGGSKDRPTICLDRKDVGKR